MKRIFVNFLFFIIYFVGYFFIAAFSTGGGHGNFYLFAPIMPIASLVLIFIAVLFLGRLKNLPLKILFVCLMFAHYGWIIYQLASYNFAEDKGWKFGVGAAIFPIIWYVVGQILIWFDFFRKYKKTSEVAT